jgi:hypothetical protein
VLVLALLVLMVFGLILGAVFNGAGAGERSTPYTRAHLNNTYAADAGIEAGLQQVRRSSNFCATAQNPSPDLQLTRLANSHDVTVSCRVVSTTNSAVGAAGYAAIVLGKTVPTILTTQGASTKVISGPVFLSGGSDLKQPLVVHAGDVDNLCGAVQPATADLKLDEGYRWSTCSQTQPVVEHLLPAEPCGGLDPSDITSGAPVTTCAPSAAGYLSLDGNCRFFLPGTYTSPPALDSGGKTNYFLSGTYHFRNIGAWPINHAAVIGGREVTPSPNAANCTKSDPTAVEGNVAVSSLPGGSLVSGYGATFVFSGNSSIDMGAGGSITVYPRLRASGDPGAWTERLSIVALVAEASDPNPTWAKSSQTTDIMKPQPGNTTTELVQGVYYTPAASLTVSATNNVVCQFVGGLVVNTLTIGESASAISLQIGMRQMTSQRVVQLTSTSTPTDGEKAVTSVAVVQVGTSAGFPVTVTSWRNSAPDF